MLGGRKVTVTRPRARHLDGSGETGLRTRENVIRLIDPAILEQALDNDLLGPA